MKETYLLFLSSNTFLHDTTNGNSIVFPKYGINYIFKFDR